MFLKDILKGEINSKLIREEYLKNISTDHMKSYMNTAKHTVFGTYGLESEKLDIVMGGKSQSDKETKQKGQGLKIMTPQQMITRLPILLAQLKAGNNSEKLKNEIRQIVYTLYRSKNLSKQSIIICLALFKNGDNIYEH